MCGFYHKPRHLKECCHWNLENLNNKLKDKKKVSVNELFFRQGKEWLETTKNKGTQIKEVFQSIVVSFAFIG
jgi:hypothetical protein